MIRCRPLLGIAALNPTYELRATVIGWVGWMTLFSSTIAIGGWVKRHPPYGLLRSPDAIRERSSRRLKNSPDCIRAAGLQSPCRSGLDRDPGAAEASRPRPLLRETVIALVGWMMLFSSTIAIGGWVKRHSPCGGIA